MSPARGRLIGAVTGCTHYRCGSSRGCRAGQPAGLGAAQTMRRLMASRKLHILGGPGSGKSFTAAKLAARYSLPVCDLDDLFWDRRADHDGVKARAATRDQALSRSVAE